MNQDYKCKPDYIVKLNELRFDKLLINYIKKASDCCINLTGEYVTHRINGEISIFSIKEEKSYFIDDWKVDTIKKEKRIILLNGSPITTCIAGCFDHPQTRTYYDHGVFHIQFLTKEKSPK